MITSLPALAAVSAIWVLAGFAACASGEELREQCLRDRLTPARLAELQQEIGEIASPELRLVRMRELFDARDTIAWQVHLITDLAQAHELAGTLDGFLTELESGAGDDSAAPLARARAAVLRSEVASAMLDPSTAHRWARVAAETAPLGSVGFWQGALQRLRRLGVIDPQFMDRVMAEPAMPGTLRVGFLLQIQNYVGFDALFKRWLSEHPGELGTALPALYTCTGALPPAPLRAALDILPAPKDPVARLRLKLMEIDLALLAGDRSAALPDLWQAFEIAGRLEATTRVGSELLRRGPALAADREDPWHQALSDSRVAKASETFASSIWHHYQNHPGPLDARGVRLRLLSLIASFDGDGSETAARLKTDIHLRSASLSSRMAHFWAAGLHLSMAEELDSAAAGAASVDEQLAALCYLSLAAGSDLSIFANRATEIGWRLQVLDSCLDMAERICRQDPGRIGFLVAEIHGRISYFLGLQPYVRARLSELVGAWSRGGGGDPEVCAELLRTLARVGPPAGPEAAPLPPPARFPSTQVLDRSELGYLSHEISAQERYFTERLQQPERRAARSMRRELNIWFYGRGFGDQAERLASLSGAELAALPPAQQHHAALAKALLALRDLEARPGVDLTAARGQALDRLRGLIGDSHGLAPLELVAAQWLMRETDPDWASVDEIASRHAASDVPAARIFATHLRAIVALAEGRGADAGDLKAEVRGAFSLQLDRDQDFGGYKNRGWSQGEPDRETSPAAWLFWASLRLTAPDCREGLAREMLGVFATSSRADGSVTSYSKALAALKVAGQLEATMAELEELARAGDKAAANVLFSVAGSDYTTLTRVEAAELLCAATDESYQAQVVLLEDALAEGDHELAYAHWLTASGHDAAKATQALMKGAETLPDGFLIRLCRAYSTRLAESPGFKEDSSVGELLATELLTREETREVGLQLAPQLFREAITGAGASSLVDRLIYQKVDPEAVTAITRAMLWPSFLAGAGLTLPGRPMRQRQGWHDQAERILNGHGRALLPPCIAEAESQGELAALHAQATRAIDAGSEDPSLLWFDFHASLAREPQRAPSALARLHSYRPPVRPRSSSRFRRTMDPEMSARIAKSTRDTAKARLQADLRLLPDEQVRKEAVLGLIRARGPQTPTWLLIDGFISADRIGDEAGAGEFFELAVEQAMTTGVGTRPALVMRRLIQAQDTERSQQLFDVLMERCAADPAQLVAGAGHAIVEFLDASAGSDHALMQQRLEWLVGIARRIERPRQNFRFPSQLWDLAVRHRMGASVLPLLDSPAFDDTPAGFHPSLTAIRQIASGAPANRLVFARLLPDASGNAVVHWDMGVGGGADIVRHRFPLDASPVRSDIKVIVETRGLGAGVETEFDLPQAAPRGKLNLPIPMRNCSSVQVTAKRPGHAGERDLSYAAAAVGENQLRQVIEASARPSADWDPSTLELNYSAAGEGDGDPAGRRYFPIASPVPIDQIMRVHFESWLRVDAPAYSPLEAGAERLIQFGFLLLDGDQKPLAPPGFAYIRGQRVEVGGSWTFASFTEHLSNLKHDQPSVAWLQFVVAWPESADLRGDVNLTLGDPWLSFTPGEQLVSDIPQVEHRISAPARPLTTQVIRDGRSIRAGLPAAAGNRLQLYLDGTLGDEVALESPPREAFVLSLDQSHIAICEDRSIWRWTDTGTARIGTLPAPEQEGRSVIVASPDGRRAARIINTPAGAVVEVFKVTKHAFTRTFTCDLRPLGLGSEPQRLGFDTAGRLILSCGGSELEISLIDHSHRLLAQAPSPALPGVSFSWGASGGRVAGIDDPLNKIEFQRPARPAPTRRILWADAAFLDPQSGETTTIEHGWFRRWQIPRPAPRR